MGKFDQLTKGTRARKEVVLPLPGARYDVSAATWEGPIDRLCVRALREDEYDIVLEKARAFAIAKGVAQPEDGDPLYERGKILHTLVLACIDKDSPADASTPYFESVEQIQTSDILTPEVIGHLFHQQELWQDEVSPFIKGMDETEYMAALIKTAGGDLGFFVNSRPGMRWSFMRTLAAQLLTYRAQNLVPSPSHEVSGSTQN